MSDKPKCPPKVWLIIGQARGHVLSKWTEEPPPEIIEYSAEHGAHVVDYIPRHSIDTLLDACQMLVNRSQNLDGSSVLSTAYDWTKLYVALQEFRPDA